MDNVQKLIHRGVQSVERAYHPPKGERWRARQSVLYTRFESACFAGDASYPLSLGHSEFVFKLFFCV